MYQQISHLYSPKLSERKSVVLKTFHPDNALPVIGFDDLNRPIFNPNKVDCPFDDNMEVQEAIYYHMISGELAKGGSHLMIDFERKSTDSRIIKRIIERLIDDHADIKIMPRSCDIKEVEDDPYRFREILTGIGSANNLFNKRGSDIRIRDLIIPQVNNHLVLRAARLTISAYQESFNDSRNDLREIKLVPLIENTQAMLNLRKNVLSNLQSIRGECQADYTRVMLAMSDTTMGSGSIASFLCLRFGLSELYRIALETQHSFLPILGGGTLPFRGLQDPQHIEQMLTVLPAYQITVQSAMTFDYGERGITDLAKQINSTHQNLVTNIERLLQQIPEDSFTVYEDLVRQAELSYYHDLIQLSRQGLSMPVILEQHGIRAPLRRNRVGEIGGGSGRDKEILDHKIVFNRAIGHVFGMLTMGWGSGTLLGANFLEDLQQQQPQIFEDVLPTLQALYKKDLSFVSLSVASHAEQLVGFSGLTELLQRRFDLVCRVLNIDPDMDAKHESHLLNGMKSWKGGDIDDARKHFQYAAIQRKAIG